MSEKLELQIKYRVARQVIEREKVSPGAIARIALMRYVETGRSTPGVQIIGYHRNPRPHNPDPDWRISNTPDKIKDFFGTLAGAVSSYIANLPPEPEVTRGLKRREAARLGVETRKTNKAREEKTKQRFARSQGMKRYHAAMAALKQEHKKWTKEQLTAAYKRQQKQK